MRSWNYVVYSCLFTESAYVWTNVLGKDDLRIH
jgi:hypothetical protein